MKICPQCQTEYDDNRKFCRHDGSPLETKKPDAETAQASNLTCPQCGKSIEIGRKFCRYCGTRLEASVQPPAVETDPTPAVTAQTKPLEEEQCPSCGAPVTPGQKFCRACGNRLEPSSPIPKATRYTSGDQTNAEGRDQALFLRVAEKKQRRQEARRKVARRASLGVVGILLIMGGVFGYRKVREWFQLPLPQEELIAKTEQEQGSLSPKELPPPPSSEPITNPPPQGEPTTPGEPPSPVTELPQGEPQTREDFSDSDKDKLAKIKPEEGTEAPLPRPDIQTNEGQEYIRQMIASAKIDGGGSNEEEILAAKRRLEALGLKSQLSHGDRKKARAENDRGLRYVQNWQFADAIQAFQDAYQADPADIEIINNLGHAHMQNGDFMAAEQFLLRALVLAPDRSSAWADLGQLYARQGDLTESVACFAHAYRFSRKKDSARQLLQRLAKDGTDKEKEAASQVLQLQLVRGDEPTLSNPPAGPPVSTRPPLPPGRYEVVRATPVFQEPRRNAAVLAQLSPGRKVNVVGDTGDYVRIESARGRPPGYIFRDDVVPAREETEPQAKRGQGLPEQTPSVPPSSKASDLTRQADEILRTVRPGPKSAGLAFNVSEWSRVRSMKGQLGSTQSAALESSARQGYEAMRQKRYQAAVEAYKVVLSYDPSSYDALFNIAGAYYELNQPDTAIEYALRAIQRKALPDLYFVVASAYVKKGDRNRAFSWLEAAIRGGFTDRRMIEDNFATLQNDPVYSSLTRNLSRW